MDLKERFDDPEEALRAAVDNALRRIWTAMPVIINEDSPDGHTATVKFSLKGQQTMPDGSVKQVEMPVLQDVTIVHQQGGAIVQTNPVKKGDEALVIFHGRPIDTWHQSGDVQNTIDGRTQSLSDATVIVGHRSDPRKIKNVSQESHQTRSVDGKQTIDHHPTTGTRIKSVDPGDASQNPFAEATKFFEASFHSSEGITHQAASEATKHLTKLTHDAGHLISIADGLHSIATHPEQGIKNISEKLISSVVGGSLHNVTPANVIGKATKILFNC